ncbi:MAG: hypothetical protein IPK19_38180 [Chloroflexi bacterium]|nr:hypothetical protein [Chloroflexota bacterium]
MTVTEPRSTPTIAANFVVTLQYPTGVQTVTVNYHTLDSTAVAGSNGDYIAANGTLTFPAGTTTQTVPVTVNKDNRQEGIEQFTFNLGNATNATITDDLGIGIINP